MRLYYKYIWVTVVIPNLQFDIRSVEKYQQIFRRETIQGILSDICSMQHRKEIYVILIKISSTPLYS